MRIFHLSDLHIGLKLINRDLREDQEYILDPIIQKAAEKVPDAIVIAGDIYDKAVPSAEAVEVFDHFIGKLRNAVPDSVIMMISGNHDSAPRVNCFRSVLDRQKIYMIGIPPQTEEDHIEKVVLQDEYGPVNFYLLPFVKPSYVRNLNDSDITTYDEAVRLVIERENIDTAKRNILVSHQFYTAAGREPETSDSEIRMVGGIENVETADLKPYDYAALGHIHRKQKIGRVQNRYCGTPLQYSVSEAGDEKTVTMVELLEKGSEPHITELPLTPMRRVRKMIGHLDGILNAAAEDNCHDYVSITLTDEVEAYQPKEKLEQVYDHILEIKIDNERTRKILEFSEEEVESLDPYDAFVTFFQEMNGRAMTEDEDNVIRTVINGEKEVAE